MIAAFGVAATQGLLTGPLASTAHAATNVVVSGTAEATSTVGTSIVSGDRFSFSFTLDLDSEATSTQGTFGNTFNNAVTAFALTAGSSNVGTWSPTGVNWQISPVDNLASNKNGDNLTLDVGASNAPKIDGVDFGDVVISLDWDRSVLDIEQVSNGTSLGTALGTTTPDVDAAYFTFQLRDTSNNSATFTASATQTNPPNTNSGDSSVAPTVELSWAVSGGALCRSRDTPAQMGTWIRVPASDDCTPPTSAPEASLLGWATDPDFPVDIAQRQVDNGWGAYETFNDDGQLTGVFIPAGGSTLVTNDTNLHPIGSQ